MVHGTMVIKIKMDRLDPPEERYICLALEVSGSAYDKTETGWLDDGIEGLGCFGG